MSVHLYNSLTKTTEEFVPRNPRKVEMFVCGPTVYDYIHLGNARSFTVFDMIAKWLRYRKFDVTYIQNITDVDDKIIRKATESGKTWKEIADRYAETFLADMQALGNDAVSRYARATDHIPQVIVQVKALIAKGNVYRIDNDGWYFDLTTFPDYGKLSGRTALEAEDAVSRIDDSSKKRNTGDFNVWKFSKEGEPVWEDSELGAGRPGWHIEDTAITQDAFGPQYDLHGGGLDLKFPHHEAEIAQQEAASGKVPFVKYWMHAGFLQMASEKMSKSVGNLTTLHDALERYPAEAIRFFLLSGHYRAPLEFSAQGLDAAAAAIQRISELLAKLRALPVNDTAGSALMQTIEETEVAVHTAMDDDFNTPTAFAAIFTLIGIVNKQLTDEPIGLDVQKRLEQFFVNISSYFGIIPSADSALPEAVQNLVQERQQSRERKDFTEADRLRDQIAQVGYVVDDTPYGPLVKKK